jgi:DNA-binding transcriptional regulator WhiA
VVVVPYYWQSTGTRRKSERYLVRATDEDNGKDAPTFVGWRAGGVENIPDEDISQNNNIRQSMMCFSYGSGGSVSDVRARNYGSQ